MADFMTQSLPLVASVAKYMLVLIVAGIVGYLAVGLIVSDRLINKVDE